MDESEWLTTTNPASMLQFMRGQMSARKLRLFAVACAHAIWDQICEAHLEETIHAAERFADGCASEEERLAHVNRLYVPNTEIAAEVRFVALATVGKWRDETDMSDLPTWQHMRGLTGHYQPDLLREIFGNPFQSVHVEPAWLTPSVLQLSREIYEEKAFERMPMLSISLLIAGCENDAVLRHCQSGNPHVRGCWVLDLLLGLS